MTGLSQAQAPPAPNTPFGMGFTPRNFPSSTIEDILPAMVAANQVGSHVSLVWSWRRQDSKPFVATLSAIASEFRMFSFLQISPTSLGDPSVPFGLPNTFTDQATRDAFLSDVQFIAELRPAYINLCAEINLMYHFNQAEFQAFISLYQEAYTLAKQISPGSEVGFSMLHSLWLGFEHFDLPTELGGPDYIDFIGFTTYPGPRFYSGELGDIMLEEFPSEWYNTMREVYPDYPIVLSEIGWASTEQGSEEDQAAFIAMLPRLLEKVHPALVTWAVLSDTEYFQTSNLTPEQIQWLLDQGVDADVLFNRFNGMGVLYFDGAIKPSWLTAVSIDFGYGSPEAPHRQNVVPPWR